VKPRHHMSCIPYACNTVIGNRAAVMNTSDMLRYKNLPLSKRQELSNSKSLVDSIPTADDLRGDPISDWAQSTRATGGRSQTDKAKGASSYVPGSDQVTQEA